MALRDLRIPTTREHYFRPGERKWWKRQYHHKLRKTPTEEIPPYGKFGGKEWDILV